ncbi:uncharacterized protein LOC130712727 [Lotus japonicus]|uniref:uncharacterized protein LOC130712727 n=1 Tax=Lotus japonicus TaxID=34305 RepID=UPI00258A879A|nr:uncharacterized protein LOC130712727 [Lotus japonicus]
MSSREELLGKGCLSQKLLVMDLIAAASLVKTVSGFGRCFDKLVKEFIVNITPECNVSRSVEFRKVYVRGRSHVAHVFEDISFSEITKEIIVRQVITWPRKGMLSTGTLSVKYALLNRIGAANWMLTNQSSHISIGLAKLIYMIGTKTPFDFGALIVALDEYPVQKASPLTFDQRLYVGTYDPDIVVDVGQVGADGAKGLRLSAISSYVLAELVEISKILQDTIVSCTQRKKKKVDLLINSLSMGKAPAGDEGNQADVEPSVGTSSDSSD